MPISVILADDHAVLRDSMKMLLEQETDIKVVSTAPDGREAVRQSRELQPDVVVMDIAMPGLNGIEATIKICESCPGTAVIILSMHETSEHIFHALKAGAKGYLIKESAGEEVIAAIREVNLGHRYLSRQIEEKVIDDYVLSQRTSAVQSPLEKLSSREREVLQLVVEGKTSIEIAEILFISQKTVDTYRSRIMQKLGIKDIPGLVKFAIQHGLTSLDTPN